MNEREAFRVLASADRQFLLYELVTGGGKATEEDLSRRVAAWRHQTSPEKIGEDEIERAHVRLVHVHLPLLLDLNIVEWDDGEVALTSDECRDRLLDVAEELDEWPPGDLLHHSPT